MKILNKFKNFSRKTLKNIKGQGMTEYILLLVVVVGIVVAFKGKIKQTIDSKLGDLDGQIQQVTPD